MGISQFFRFFSDSPPITLLQIDSAILFSNEFDYSFGKSNSCVNYLSRPKKNLRISKRMTGEIHKEISERRPNDNTEEIVK